MSTSEQNIHGKLYWDPKRPWGCELIANSLVDHGIECVFSLCGGHNAPILKAAADKGIKVVGTRTEAAAVYAAAGYSLVSGNTGVAIITAAMLTFAADAIANITLGQIPVVIISGATETYADGLRTIQEIDQMPIAKALFAKDAFHVTKLDRLPEQLSWAFAAARTGIPGCTFIDIPIDIVASRGEAGDLKPRCVNKNVKSGGDPDCVREAVRALSESAHPIINVGRLAVAAGAGEEIREFMELTGIPVDVCMGAVGEHELNIGGSLCPDADVVLMLGKRSQGMPGSQNYISYQGKVINVYPESEDFGHCYPVDTAIAGDVKLVMRQMIEEAGKVKFGDYSPWISELKKRREELKALLDQQVLKNKDNKPIHPVVCTKVVTDWMVENNLHREALVSFDGAANLMWWFQMASAYGLTACYPAPELSLTSFQLSLGSIGPGLCVGLGGAMAQPERMLIVPSMGDGALGYHMAELETMARENIPAVIVVHNNSAWGMVYDDQRRIWGRGPDNAPGIFLGENLHYEKVAEGLGCPRGEFVEEPGGIRQALDRAYARARKANKPVVVNVITDPDVYVMEYPWWLLPATPEGEPYIAA